MILTGGRLEQITSCNILTNDDDIIDIFSIESDVSCSSIPKVVSITLKDSEGRAEEVEVALMDGGAMVAGLDERLYERVKDQISGWEPSTKRLRMANGTVIRAKVQWRGKVLFQGSEVDGILQVFNSGGSWDVLFGKPLLQAFGVVHDFGNDSVVIK
ncbi:uncharacterized protein C8R40DRAFT_1032882, partial [Lentinula edodes]|uniref:uncharacterized protein n=1 Tax=Lentinula edodes TaxID=5353 RepID=UPI001E8CCFED